MRSRLFSAVGILVPVCVLLGSVACHQSARASEPTQSGAAESAAAADDARALAARIDEHIAAGWQAGPVQPAPPADDAAYLRRTYLNIVGKIPTVWEVRQFLDDPSPDKRQLLTERLLEGPAYIGNFANFWRSLMLPEATANSQLWYLVPQFEDWLRLQLAKNAGYDVMVRDLLTTSLANDQQQQRGFMLASGDRAPVAYFWAKQFMPENIAAGTSRLFLGVRLECAQCHDHPFAKWERDEFWSFAAFFAGISGNQNGQFTDVPSRKELTIPETERVVQARFLGGKPFEAAGTLPRKALADWIASADNPYFARAGANRIWAHFFGVGIVHPPDDFDENNPPSHPELLDELAREFAAHDFDVKFLIRAITASKTYQLSSQQTHQSQSEPRRFARMTVKGMTPEQIFDSLATATGYFENVPLRDRFNNNSNSVRGQIRELFSRDNASPTDSETSILQALALMNGTFVADATGLGQSATLAAVVDAPFFSTADRIETLYLATLTRKPRADELSRLSEYVESGGTKNDAKAALGDVLWALLNSSEFILNH